MAKRLPKPKCIHGLSPVFMRGCPHCVTLAMDCLHLMQFMGINAEELQMLLTHQYGTRDKVKAALPAAKRHWESLAANRAKRGAA